MKVGDKARFIAHDDVFHYGEREGKIGTIVMDGTLNRYGINLGTTGICGWQIEGEEGIYITALDDLLKLNDPAPAASEGGTGTKTEPVPMTIWCPKCALPHIDEGEWSTRPHKTHQCQGCGYEWRPFEFATVGVASVEGQRTGEASCREVAAIAYQIVGALDAPVRILDYFSAVAQGEFAENPLPFSPEEVMPNETRMGQGISAVTGDQPSGERAGESSVPGVEGMGAREIAQALWLIFPRQHREHFEYKSWLTEATDKIEAYARSLRGAGGEQETCESCEDWKRNYMSSNRLRHASESREQAMRERAEEEQKAHEQIGSLLLPLVGTGDGTSVDAARRAKASIEAMRECLGKIGNVIGRPTTHYASEGFQLKEQTAKLDAVFNLVSMVLKKGPTS